MSEYTDELLVEIRDLLTNLVEIFENNQAGPVLPKRSRALPQLSEEAKQAVIETVNEGIDAWFEAYGDEPLPAKFINFSGFPFNKPEKDFVFRKLQEFVGYKNEAGTHEFKYLGKVYCSRLKNMANCFAFVAI